MPDAPAATAVQSASAATAAKSEPAPNTKQTETVAASTESAVTHPAVAAVADASKADLERRAAVLAAAKRKETKLRADRESFAKQRTEAAENDKLAGEYRRLAKLQADDPLAYLEAVGLKVPDISRRYLEKQTGHGKTPEQIADEVYQRNRAAERKASDEAAAKQQTEQQAKAREDAYAGARKQIAALISANADALEICNALGEVAVHQAFEKVLKHWESDKQVLDFRKALDSVESEYRVKLVSSKTLASEIDKKKAADVEAAKKQPKTKEARNTVEPRQGVETAEKKSPPEPKARYKPLDYRAMAKELWEKNQASKDT